MSRFEDRKVQEEAGDTNPFTMYYGQLLHQGNMLQDQVRTGRYQQAIFDNAIDFRGKVVLDVGTGTGILSFFAAQAGARKVYAVELSDAAIIAETLAKSNGFEDIIQVVRGKVEEVIIPEKVDIIISEPLGFLLVHERMLESYVAARDRFLKPRGKMFPTTGDIVFGPITDETIHTEQGQKAAFWENKNFFNIDLSAVAESAYAEFYTQAIVGFFPSSSLLSSTRTVHKVDFLRVSREELLKFEIPFSFRIDKTAVCHGFGCWFDVNFIGTAANVELSTGPDHPGTHWYQCRLLLREAIAVNRNQSISGSLLFEVNDKFSYCVTARVQLDGTDVYSENRINLHDQVYHYLSSTTSAVSAASGGY